VIGRVAKLIARTQLTRGRLVFLLGMGAIVIVFSFIISATSGAGRYTDTISTIDKYGLGVVAPVVGLVLASAALGDMVDDRTLVYLWLRPVPRWQISLGAALASIGTALPLVVIPVTLAAAVGSGDAKAVGAAAAASAVATLGYAGLFLALGFKVRRALVWGIAYILIWEGFLARSVGFAAKLSVSVYATSLLNHMSDTGLPKHPAGPIASVVVPVLVAIAGVVLTARWLKTTEVA
jgi:ABC-2 type transport system permease protein